MNLNQPLINKKTTNGPPTFRPMGPPIKPPPKSRTSKQKSTSTPSSGTQWGNSCHTIHNSSTLRSASTSISEGVESRVIVALTEGRGDARGEVGLASIDLSLPNLILCQISDSQSYINTLTKINIFNPTDIIVPSTFLDNDNRLIDKIRRQFPTLKILRVPRKTFNGNSGMDRILQLCLPSANTICVGLQHKYYALAAASALTGYLHNNLNIYYAKGSINVTYQESEGYAIIDVSTADRLELVSSTKPAQATKFSTLFGVLNHCVTKVGARLLRSTILQPPSAPAMIEVTAQSVAELIKKPEILTSIRMVLEKVSNIDQLLTITSMNLGTTDSCSVRQLNYLLLLNGLIDLVQPLKDVIEECQQPFYKDLKQTLESGNFGDIAGKIRAMIHPAAQFAKGEAGVGQRCFAIKSDVNGLLDLVRKTFSERLNDLKEYVRHLGCKYNLPLTLGNNNVKGYHIVLKLSNPQKRTFKKSDLPPEFVQVYRLAGSCTMKTAELINLSTRLEDIMLEIMKISNSMIYNLIVDLKQYVGFFYKLCEDLARLDMVQSLAEASRRGGYVRPKFADFTELTNARHPMLELLIGEHRVANPISICRDFNVQIVTGPNGSGKSIYIRQVMLLQVMAQVGCYVPAESAIFKPMSRMFARIYLEDDIEYGASSFILEMKEVKYMMTLVSQNSLFVIDELCRSTAADEGAALAMAICEKFCSTGVFLLVTTHYTSLADLGRAHLNVKTWQMETVATGETPQDLVLDFRFKLIPGVTNLRHYGVYIVKKIWPERILEEVYSILGALKEDPKDPEYEGVDDVVRLKYKLEADLRKLKSVGKLTRAAVNKLLNGYQEAVGIPLDLSVETSSYRELSNFLQEDSDNINMLVPEVSLASSERELCLSDFEKEELEIARSFLEEDDEDFDFSQTSAKHVFDEAPPQRVFGEAPPQHSFAEAPPPHIFPVVTVMEGPRWISDCSFSTAPRSAASQTSESISYSPLRSPISDRTVVQPHTSTSSSLHFQAGKDANPVILRSSVDQSASSYKESTDSVPNVVRKKRLIKFVPPKRLTRREIQEEFDQQDRKFYNPDVPQSDLSKYLSQILNRPSVKQVQNSKHLAFVRRTEEGVEVIPVVPEPVKKKPFRRNLSSSSNNIDMSIFSDKNAKCFDEFVNSNERDVKRFKFNFDSGSFQPQSISEYAENVDKVQFCFKSGNSRTSSEEYHSLTPDGFYKENREDINNIISKYLPDEGQDSSNIFETCSLDENDLEL